MALGIGYLCSHCNKVSDVPRNVIIEMYKAIMGYSPQHELKISNDLAQELGNLKVIFDIGSRDDIEYLRVYPSAEYHLFEPNPEFFEKLMAKVKDLSNVHANCFGLGNVEGDFPYSNGLEATSLTERFNSVGDRKVHVKTLDNYIFENHITRIDLLKSDTEGGDHLVFLGGKTAFPITKFIQYEHWNNMESVNRILGDDFETEYMGYRNVFCMNKKLVSKTERQRIRDYIRNNKLGELV